MARVATSNLGLGTWSDGENPGAGSQSVNSTGLNGNAIKIDTAVGNEHNADGTHKSNKIDKAHLKTTVADGSTIEKHSTNGLQLKDAGITAAKLATDAVETAKIKNDAVTSDKLATGAIAVGGDAIAAGAIKAADFGASAVDTAAIKDANVTAAKMEYKFLKGYLSQAGTGHPTLTIIKNTLGQTPTVTRNTTGEYFIETTGSVFTAAEKTFLMICQGKIYNGFARIEWDGVSLLIVSTHNFAGAAADSLLSDTLILIEVYP